MHYLEKYRVSIIFIAVTCELIDGWNICWSKVSKIQSFPLTSQIFLLSKYRISPADQHWQWAFYFRRPAEDVIRWCGTNARTNVKWINLLSFSSAASAVQLLDEKAWKLQLWSKTVKSKMFASSRALKMLYVDSFNVLFQRALFSE